MNGLTEREMAVYKKAVEEGWKVLRHGWPDFLLYNEKENKAVFLEVKALPTSYEIKHGTKTGYGMPSENQEEVHRVLRKLGHRVQVVHVK